MLGWLNQLFYRFTGFGASPVVSLRETPRGYRIETEYLEEGGAALSCHVWSFAIVFLWAGALGYWVGELPRQDETVHSPALLVLALIASAISLGWSMMRGPRSYVVELDLTRDQLWHGYARGGTAEFAPRPVPFAEIRDVVMGRARGGPGEKVLVARMRGAGRGVELARGGEAVLSAIYHRVAPDLRPIETRLAPLAERGASRAVPHPAFPPLGPHEIGV